MSGGVAFIPIPTQTRALSGIFQGVTKCSRVTLVSVFFDVIL